MSMGAKTEYVKSLRAKALLADAKAASMLQLEEVRLHSFRIVLVSQCRIVQ